jgi:hypothetical protein
MSRRIQWCPRCKEQSLHEDGGRFENDNIYTWLAKQLEATTGGLERYAFLHSLFVESLPEFPHIGGYFRYRKCSACSAVWTSIEAPDLFFLLITKELEKVVKERNGLAAELVAARQKHEAIRALLGPLNEAFSAGEQSLRIENSQEGRR